MRTSLQTLQQTNLCIMCFLGRPWTSQKIDILKTITSKKERIGKDLQELKKLICPNFQQAACEIPAQKAGVKQHSLILTAALNQQGEAYTKKSTTLYRENSMR